MSRAEVNTLNCLTQVTSVIARATLEPSDLTFDKQVYMHQNVERQQSYQLCIDFLRASSSYDARGILESTREASWVLSKPTSASCSVFIVFVNALWG